MPRTEEEKRFVPPPLPCFKCESVVTPGGLLCNGCTRRLRDKGRAARDNDPVPVEVLNLAAGLPPDTPLPGNALVDEHDGVAVVRFRPRPAACRRCGEVRELSRGGLCRECDRRHKTDPSRPPCRHCGLTPASRPRGLCWSCYYRSGVREQHASTSKFANRGEGLGPRFKPVAMPEPTTAPPGSEEKIRVLCERARRRQELFHPQDPKDTTVGGRETLGGFLMLQPGRVSKVVMKF